MSFTTDKDIYTKEEVRKIVERVKSKAYGSMDRFLARKIQKFLIANPGYSEIAKWKTVLDQCIKMQADNVLESHTDIDYNEAAGYVSFIAELELRKYQKGYTALSVVYEIMDYIFEKYSTD